MKKHLFSILLVLFFFSAFTQTPRINFTAPKVYPEGTAYYEEGKSFFVSSVTTGTIGKVDADGNYTVVYEDHSLKSSYGMKVDRKRNKLWVCTGDANYSIYSDSGTFKKLARLISLDLSSGQKIDDIDLSTLINGKHFLNDLTLDPDGNIYITDSYSAAVYKVDQQMKPSIFSQSEFFQSIDVGLNGIVWHPEGFILVAHSTNGALYRIKPQNANEVEKVKIENFFPGADGLLLDHSGSIALVQNKGSNKIYNISSRNGWRTAKITSSTLLVDRFDNPTTLTRKGNQLYALNAKLNELSDPTRPPSKQFSLQLVRFVPML